MDLKICRPLLTLPLLVVLPLNAQEMADEAAEEAQGPRLEISGHVMTDMIYENEQSDPDWFDVVRPSKLPSFEGEFGADGNFYASVRQSRLSFDGYTPTLVGELHTLFEFELFGVGDDAGQTTFRLRHAWGEIGRFGAGQTWSPFMDPDVFPNSLEYWGPNGMVFFRNVQMRWTPWQVEDSRIAVAIERPGATADQGIFADRIELEGVVGSFPLPDLSAHYRHARDWGHVQIAGILRQIEWEDVNDDQFDLDGDELGWGINLSSNINVGRHVARLQVVYGEGIQNYMNDAPVDVGIETNFGNPVTPIRGEVLPVLGVVAFMDFNWSDKWTSTAGYSLVDIDNSNGQAPNAFEKGDYALVNLLYHPLESIMVGAELQWAERENFRDDFTSDNVRLQFSAKFLFGVQ